MMIHEHSYGIIPLRKEANHWEVLLICHQIGSFWCFPKGHGEKGESAYQTAIRELKEETGLQVRQLLMESTLQEQYTFWSTRGHIHKAVTYYVAEVEGKVELQKEEVADYQWVPVEIAESKITFSEGKSLMRQVQSLLNLEAKTKRDQPPSNP